MRIKKLIAFSFIYSSIHCAYSFPSIDVGKVLERSNETTQQVNQHAEKIEKSDHILNGNIYGDSNLTDTWNNDFANMIARDEEIGNKRFNQLLKQQSTPVNVCNDLSASSTLNELSCDALDATSKASDQFIGDLTQPAKVGHDHVNDQISNPMTITVTTAPEILKNMMPHDQVNLLREYAFKSTANSAMKTSTEDQKNIYNTLSNSAIDSFSTDSLKDITESTTRAYVIRKLAVMKAKEIYALMIDYKHQLQKEQLLATRLIELNQMTVGSK